MCMCVWVLIQAFLDQACSYPTSEQSDRNHEVSFFAGSKGLTQGVQSYNPQVLTGEPLVKYGLSL